MRCSNNFFSLFDQRELEIEACVRRYIFISTRCKNTFIKVDFSGKTYSDYENHESHGARLTSAITTVDEESGMPANVTGGGPRHHRSQGGAQVNSCE